MSEVFLQNTVALLSLLTQLNDSQSFSSSLVWLQVFDLFYNIWHQISPSEQESCTKEASYKRPSFSSKMQLRHPEMGHKGHYKKIADRMGVEGETRML